jgi:trehalose 6-phosphate phosphatase
MLAEFARSNVLVAFDFDGTLAPIVAHPSDAAVAPGTRGLLHRVGRLYPTAVISGRRRAEARRLLHGTGIRHVVGNHGADLAPIAHDLKRLLAHWRNSLRQELAGLQGVWVEDKGLSLAVHYRNSPQRQAMRRRVWAAAQKLKGARVTPAKEAVNVMLPSAPDKGEAVGMLQRQLGCERVIFVGDDHTDEDVFSREWDGALLGVSVGARKSAAEYRLRGQGDIDRFLDVLARLRDER